MPPFGQKHQKPEFKESQLLKRVTVGTEQNKNGYEGTKIPMQIILIAKNINWNEIKCGKEKGHLIDYLHKYYNIHNIKN